MDPDLEINGAVLGYLHVHVHIHINTHLLTSAYDNPRVRGSMLVVLGSVQWRIQDLKEGGARLIAREARMQNF